MANKYCNLDGTKKIKDEYPKINVGFDNVDIDVSAVNAKVGANLLENKTYTDTKTKVVADDLLAHKIDYATLNDRVDTIVTTPVPVGEILAQEIIDSRQEELSLGANLTGIKGQIDTQLVKTSKQINKNFAQSTRNTVSTVPLISFIDDDGTDGIITDLKPLFVARGVPCGCSVIGTGAVITNSDYRQQLLDLQNNYGWEILSHTTNHLYLNSATDKEIEDDCINYLKLMSGHGFNVNSIVYPGGEKGNVDIISKYYVAGFDTANTFNTLGLDPYGIHRYALGSFMPIGQDNLTFFKGVIDGAITNKRWVIFMLHSGSSTNDMQLIEDVLDYAIAQSVKIVNPNDGLRYFAPMLYSGNIQTGKYLSISQNGEINTNKYNLQHDLSAEVITNSTPPSFFTIGVSTLTLPGANSADFPLAGGTLITRKINNSHYYIHQYWYPYTKDYFYFRRASSIDAWNTWARIPISSEISHFMLPGGSVTDASLPSAYPVGESNCLVTGWTTVGNGMLKTINPGVSGYIRQVFYKGSANAIYTRSHNGTSWSSWANIQYQV